MGYYAICQSLCVNDTLHGALDRFALVKIIVQSTHKCARVLGMWIRED